MYEAPFCDKLVTFENVIKMRFTGVFMPIGNDVEMFSHEPAHAVMPGACVTDSGIVFAAVLRPTSADIPCGLMLFHLPSGRIRRIPFTDSDRIGSLYSICFTGPSAAHPEKLAYCFYLGDQLFNDPYARRLVPVKDENGRKITVSALSEIGSAVHTTPLRGRYKWTDRFVYQLNVRSFTKEKGSGVPAEKRGTFAGVVEKIPYLRSLGVTTVELMPVYEICPPKENRTRYFCSSFTIDAVPEKGTPEDLTHELALASKPNLWGFGEGYYNALKSQFAVHGMHPEKEFAAMVDSLHEAGMEVTVQLYFPDQVSPGIIYDTVRFYMSVYAVDGVHLLGSRIPLAHLARDPVLSDTLLYYYSFPYEQLKSDVTSGSMRSAAYPPAGMLTQGNDEMSVFGANLADCNDDFMYLLRRFVKGDDCVLRDFIRSYLAVPEGHGALRYAADYNGFTLNDLVTYSRKHNEENGEDNRDGNDNNASWNCGIEGKSRRKDMIRLRRQQIRNFLALVMTAQGSPLLYAGDESGNTAGGNNNPYCQDNPVGWTDWKDTAESRGLLSFARALSAFRRSHPVLHELHPFRYSDYRSLGYPDLSFHGKEAWKPDFSDYSHAVGILFCEDYDASVTLTAGTAPRHLLYLAVNMYWQDMDFGLPDLPSGQVWRLVMDTSLDEPFPAVPADTAAEACFTASARSVAILESSPVPAEQPEPAPDTDAVPVRTGRKKHVAKESEKHV